MYIVSSSWNYRRDITLKAGTHYTVYCVHGGRLWQHWTRVVNTGRVYRALVVENLYLVVCSYTNDAESRWLLCIAADASHTCWTETMMNTAVLEWISRETYNLHLARSCCSYSTIYKQNVIMRNLRENNVLRCIHRCGLLAFTFAIHVCHRSSVCLSSLCL